MAEEARLAVAVGVDALAVQSAAAGGHWGTLTPRSPAEPLPLGDLLAAVRAQTDRPLIAAGGVATAADVVATMSAGASAVMVGTVLLLSAESGAPAVHHLTSGLRRAAAAAGDADLVHLWAGTGYRHATAEPAAAILTRLAGHV